MQIDENQRSAIEKGAIFFERINNEHEAVIFIGRLQKEIQMADDT